MRAFAICLRLLSGTLQIETWCLEPSFPRFFHDYLHLAVERVASQSAAWMFAICNMLGGHFRLLFFCSAAGERKKSEAWGGRGVVF